MSTGKIRYNTKQRQILLNYLSAVRGQNVTVNDVCDYFISVNVPIGQTTIYRHLENLVAEGIVRKYVFDGNSPACFEYVGTSDLGLDCSFNCKCESCGCLIQVRCEMLEGIQKHLKEHHNFNMNPIRTVFYGLCDDCATAGR